MTDMHIMKVMVTELPGKCVECGYGYSLGDHGACRALSFTGESPQKIDKLMFWDGRPLFCPLVKQKDGEE